jgi:prephenate dehydrogenase
MQQVTIVGLGLIGASIGLGLRRWSTNDGKRQPVLTVTGFDTNLEHQNYAKKIHAVDNTEWDLPKAIQNADMVIVAVPPLAVRSVFESISGILKPGAVVTDVTSTKADVMQWAKEILPSNIHFVGGHPMAGKAMSIEGAEADLFQNATWCVVPAVSADENAVQTVLGMVSALGAEATFVDAHEHDGFVGAVSHLPFMLSIALMNSVSRDPAWRDMKLLSSTGFQDVSRLAGGSAEMHRDICITNRDAVVRWMDVAINDMQNMRDMIAANTPEADDQILDVFENARDARASWATAERRAGALVQDTDSELTNVSMAGQFNQMLFGSMLRRKPRVGDASSDGRKNGKRESSSRD